MTIALRFTLLVLVATWVAGCGRRDAVAPAPKGDTKRKVVLQTDWFPQAEHGGFYQALAKGFYAQAGLDVEIWPGGPGSGIKLKVARGDADFGMLRSDDLMLAAGQGMPLVMVAATLQHDGMALLVHEAPVRSSSIRATTTCALLMTIVLAPEVAVSEREAPMPAGDRDAAAPEVAAVEKETLTGRPAVALVESAQAPSIVVLPRSAAVAKVLMRIEVGPCVVVLSEQCLRRFVAGRESVPGGASHDAVMRARNAVRVVTCRGGHGSPQMTTVALRARGRTRPCHPASASAARARWDHAIARDAGYARRTAIPARAARSRDDSRRLRRQDDAAPVP